MTTTLDRNLWLAAHLENVTRRAFDPLARPQTAAAKPVAAA